MNDEVDFLHADKHESFLQIDSMILDGDDQAFPKFLKQQVLQCLYNTSKKKLDMKLIFCMQINIKISYKLISKLWASLFPRGNIIIIDGHDQA